MGYLMRVKIMIIWDVMTCCLVVRANVHGYKTPKIPTHCYVCLQVIEE
jgi:hypothetical protein